MGSIAIVGLGHGETPLVPRSVLDRIESAGSVVVSSEGGAAAEFVRSLGAEPVTYEALGLDPASSSVEIVVRLADAASAEGGLVLVAAGYPFMKEGVVSGLLDRTEGPLELFPLSGAFEVLLMAFDVDLTADLDIVDARTFSPARLERGSHLVVTGVRTPALARRVSERLHEFYPVGHRIVVARPAGDGFELVQAEVGEETAERSMCTGCSVYVPPASVAPPTGFAELVRIVSVLRGPGGCPWDLEQTHMTLRQNMIEEAYEAVAAIESGDEDALAEELGDVLAQVALHSQIASETGAFDIADVTSRIVGKLRHRHPHIFGTAEAGTAGEVIRRWDQLKAEEKSGRHGVLEGVPHALPALLYAQKVSRRAAAVGFDWETVEHVWEKVHEEIAELKAAEDRPEIEEELGDLLFTLVNVARKSGVDAETALRSATDKFRARFELMEAEASGRGMSLGEMDTGEMEESWGRAKAARPPVKRSDYEGGSHELHHRRHRP